MEMHHIISAAVDQFALDGVEAFAPRTNVAG
jgi:hypothetical protein